MSTLAIAAAAGGSGAVFGVAVVAALLKARVEHVAPARPAPAVGVAPVPVAAPTPAPPVDESQPSPVPTERMRCVPPPPYPRTVGTGRHRADPDDESAIAVGTATVPPARETNEQVRVDIPGRCRPQVATALLSLHQADDWAEQVPRGEWAQPTGRVA